jgi:ABC-type nickel/cobalt efflux system permease component RcnA
MLALALISLAYGIFHALGPGHGKTIVSTFFLAEEAKLRHSLIAGYLIALVHAVSALAIVLALYFIVQGVFSTGFESASRIVQTLSFGAIAVIGAVILIQRIRGKEHSHALGKGHAHDHAHADDHDGEPRQATIKELFGIALASGVVPCPGASAIILVCLSLNVLLAGVVAVVMISIGMGMTVTVIGALAILAKRGVLKASSSSHGGGARIARRIVEIAGASVLFAFGLSLFVAQFI